MYFIQTSMSWFV